jgi:S1-C subfamily serine protease
MKPASRRTTLVASTLSGVALACVMLTAALASAQELTTALRLRIARSLALSTVSVEASGGRGSGFVVGPERWILTSCHVVGCVRSGLAIRVVFGSGMGRTARVLEIDEDHDLALLVLDGARAAAPPLTLSASGPVAVGQSVVALGAPARGVPTIEEGIVTALPDVELTLARSVRGVVQTEIAITEELTGSPLVDRRGEVIGVRWAGVRGDAMLSLAIPSRYAIELLRLARASGSPSGHATPRPAPPVLVALGLIVEDAAPGQLSGVRVLAAVPGSAAAQADIVGTFARSLSRRAPALSWSGVIVTAADLHPIGDIAELNAYLAGCASGQAVQLSVRSSLDDDAPTGEVSVVVERTP